MIAIGVWAMLRANEYTVNKKLRYWQYRILYFADIIDIKHPKHNVPTYRITLKVTKCGQRISITPELEMF